MIIKNNVKLTKHKPPSRIKYEQRNPVFSIRMPQAWHDILKELLEETGVDRKTFMGIVLNKLKANHEQIYKQGSNEGYKEGHKNGLKEGKEEGITLGKEEGYTDGYNKGYAKGTKDHAIVVYCARCKKEMTIEPLSMNHTLIVEAMMGRISHKICP
jgi:flagellar biosynthesis/type III secretory pathway protein FliH